MTKIVIQFYNKFPNDKLLDKLRIFQNILWKCYDIYIDRKEIWHGIYTGVAGQGLNRMYVDVAGHGLSQS